MIKVTDMNGRAHFLAHGAIARIVEAGPNWHGIRSYIKTFDGKTIEAAEDAESVSKAVAAAKPEGGEHA